MGTFEEVIDVQTRHSGFMVQKKGMPQRYGESVTAGAVAVAHVPALVVQFLNLNCRLDSGGLISR
jgi:hypothetical protein